MRRPRNYFNVILANRSNILLGQDGLPVDTDESPITLYASVAIAAVVDPIDADLYSRVIGCPPPHDCGIGRIMLLQYPEIQR